MYDLKTLTARQLQKSSLSYNFHDKVNQRAHNLLTDVSQYGLKLLELKSAVLGGITVDVEDF